MTGVAVLDDYQGCALQMANWTALPANVRVQVFHDHLTDEDALVERLKEFEIIVAMRERTRFTRGLLKRLPKLRLLVTTGFHRVSIDLQTAADCNIVVCGTEGVFYTAAELTWGLILALVRHIPLEDRATREGRWQISVGEALHGKTLGVMGLGRVGSQVATVGHAFGMSVVAWSDHMTAERAAQCGATNAGKEETLARADILTIHLDLNDHTRGLVGRSELGLMKPTAYLVNTSRGPIVDEAALVEALQKKTIAGAGLDVYDEEPLPLDHPLRRLDNTVLTPHLGYVTKDGYRLFYGQAVEDIQAFLKGSPVRVLNTAKR